MAGDKSDRPDGGPVISDNEFEDLGDGSDGKKATADDRADMWRLGKKQELTRNFGLVSIFGFSMVLMASWEVALDVATIGLIDGGTGGLIWIFFIVWLAFLLINTSMAEMGSMAPTTGGQYHWVSEFAPRQHQKFLSYLMGWFCVLGWQAGGAATAYVAATQIQGLVVLNYPDYAFEQWHGTLIMMAISAFSVIFNVFLARNLPLIEGILLIIHICAWIGIVVTLWVLAPIGDTSVFTQFNDAGWHSTGTTALIGVTGAISPLLGSDAAAHMSEELKDAGKTLPRSMIWATIVNGAQTWIILITLCFTLGNLDEILATPTRTPYIQVFYNITKSTASTTAMVSMVIAVSIACNLTNNATASRQLYAFARDKGMPCSSWLAKISWGVPANAVYVTFFTTAVLSVINIGSSTALNSILGLGTAPLLTSYMTSIGCVTWRRLTGNPLPSSKFSLGKLGLPINLISEVSLAVFFVFCFFPASPNPDAAGMNWSILIYSVVIIWSLTYYAVWGRHVYVGPVEYTRKLD